MKRFSRNFLAIIGSDIARRVLGFLAIAYLARKVGVDNFGAINIGFAVISYAVMISAIGLTFYGTREIARGRTENLVNRIVSIRLVTGFVAYVVVFLITILFVSRETAFLIMIFCFSILPFSFLIEWYYQGRERMGYIGAGRLISAVIYFGLIFILVHSVEDIVWVAVAAVSGDFAHAIFLWIIYRKKFKGDKFHFIISGWRDLLKSSFPLGYGTLIGGLSANLPQIILGILMTNYEVGIYSAAIKLILFLLMFDRVLGTLLLPAGSRLQEISPSLLTLTLTQAMKWILLLTLPICVGGSILSEDIILFVFGSQYTESVVLFMILIWFFLFTMLHTIYTSGLIAIGKEKIYGKVMLISGFLYLVLITGGVLLIGATGTALGMVLSEVITFLIMRYHFHKISELKLPASIWKFLVSSLIMGIIVYMLPDIHVIYSIIIGMVIYILLIIVSKSVTVEEFISLIKKV